MSLIASCHCGATRIELPHAPTHAKECNCTFCYRTGAIWAYFGPDELKVIAADEQGMYSASGMNHHYLCRKCGMHTWGDSPDWASMYNMDGTPKDGEPGAVPTQRVYAVNLRMVDGLDISRVEIEQIDGRNSW